MIKTISTYFNLMMMIFLIFNQSTFAVLGLPRWVYVFFHLNSPEFQLIQTIESENPLNFKKIKNIFRKHSDININYVDRLGQTAFIVAVKKGQIDIAQFLLEQGAHLNLAPVRDQTQHSALLLALDKGHENMAQWLIENKADIHDRNKQNESPLIIAIHKGYGKIVQQLIENQVNLEERNACQDTALIYAIQESHSFIVQLLINNHANVNATGYLGDSPLMWAIRKGNIQILTWLLSAKDINPRHLETALKLAQSLRYTAMCRLIESIQNPITPEITHDDENEYQQDSDHSDQTELTQQNHPHTD